MLPSTSLAWSRKLPSTALARRQSSTELVEGGCRRSRLRGVEIASLRGVEKFMGGTEGLQTPSP
jgi:hypothetical protein